MSRNKLPNQEDITLLSELRLGYSCFDEKEEPYYQALSKAIQALKSEGDLVSRKSIIEFIKNAPTVENDVTEKQAITKIINSGWLVNHDKELRDKWERPRGKWIEVDIKPTPFGGYTCNRKCNRCDYFTKEYRLNFCPNCGAYMKGGAENDR